MVQTTRSPKTVFIEETDAEWPLALKDLWIADGRPTLADGSADHERKQHGEVWQYMGTFCMEGFWRHEFRHRAHPWISGGGRKVLRVIASDDFHLAHLCD